MTDQAPQKSEPSQFETFRAALGKIVSVPKAEILRREKEAKAERARMRKQRNKK